MTTLEEKTSGLIEDILKFHDHADHWYGHNQVRKNILLCASWTCTAMAVICGISGIKAEFSHFAGPLAAIFSAINGALLKALSQFKLSPKSIYYGDAITRCDEFTMVLKFDVENEKQFDTVFSDFKALRRMESKLNS